MGSALLDHVAETIMIIDIQNMNSVGLRKIVMARDEQHVLVIVHGCAIPEIVAAGDHDRAWLARIDHDNLVMDDGMGAWSCFKQLPLPMPN